MNNKRIQRATRASIVLSIIVLSAKYFAYRVTLSQAVLSDALEGIVNVVAAFSAAMLISAAQKPADKEHPYGHGKLEYFSAVFEGGMIFLAGIWVAIEAIQALIDGSRIQQFDIGLVVLALAMVANLLLGLYLNRVGKEERSFALRASAAHLFSDVWTSLAAMVALFLVRWTGYTVLDPLIAIPVGFHLGWTGLKVVRRSAGDLLDEADQEVISTVASLFSDSLFPGIIRIHATRVIRAGRYHHIDSHVVVPEFWTTETAHQETARFEKGVLERYPYQGEIHFHIDPCRKNYCRVCDYPSCPVRREVFERRIPLNVQELINPEEPTEFRE